MKSPPAPTVVIDHKFISSLHPESGERKVTGAEDNSSELISHPFTKHEYSIVRKFSPPQKPKMNPFSGKTRRVASNKSGEVEQANSVAEKPNMAQEQKVQPNSK